MFGLGLLEIILGLGCVAVVAASAVGVVLMLNQPRK
jgi:hypothetical protein